MGTTRVQLDAMNMPILYHLFIFVQQHNTYIYLLRVFICTHVYLKVTTPKPLSNLWRTLPTPKQLNLG